MYDLAPEDVRHSLEPETHAEDGDFGLQQAAGADSEIAIVCRMAGAWGKDDGIRSKVEDLVPCQLVVADHDGSRTSQLAYELVEVVGKRVVVIDEQDLHGVPRSDRAITPPGQEGWLRQ